MPDFVDVHSGLPSRRTVIGAAAWSVPVIALVTATPAFAASSVGMEALVVRSPRLRNERSGGKPGPIRANLHLAYRSSSSHDPNVVAFAWTLTASGPTGSHTVASGADNIARYRTWSKTNIKYPGSTSNLPTGTYTFTFTVAVAGSGTKSSTDKIKI